MGNWLFKTSRKKTGSSLSSLINRSDSTVRMANVVPKIEYTAGSDLAKEYDGLCHSYAGRTKECPQTDIILLPDHVMVGPHMIHIMLVKKWAVGNGRINFHCFNEETDRQTVIKVWFESKEDAETCSANLLRLCELALAYYLDNGCSEGFLKRLFSVFHPNFVPTKLTTTQKEKREMEYEEQEGYDADTEM